MADYLVLSYMDLALTAGLMILNGGISIWLKLGLNRSLLLASLRTILQLLLIGLILRWVFTMDRWYLVLLVLTVMTLLAGLLGTERCRLRYPGMRRDSILAIGSSAWLVAGLAVFAIITVEPWYRPQYTIPILGMILGNSLTGVALGLDRLTQGLLERRDEVDGWLALGASRWEAARPFVREAVRAALIPTLNAMAAVGIVSLPGMMTGQLLAGVEPVEAVKYQIVIMFLIASATALGSVGVILLAYRRLFNSLHQFQAQLLTPRDPP